MVCILMKSYQKYAKFLGRQKTDNFCIKVGRILGMEPMSCIFDSYDTRIRKVSLD